ncbi:WD repeat-containing protein 3 [Oryzias melastigma]|uniref:WD repeat-containing protein 3 n=1 Tax=Oryzias melastigma TaxID=30732 RepID=UPI00168CFC17|nr:WD repeat-containing protein 3 [Oryzias melastigma]
MESLEDSVWGHILLSPAGGAVAPLCSFFTLWGRCSSPATFAGFLFLLGRYLLCCYKVKVALLLQNNTIETYSLKTSDKNPSASKTARLTLGGHRTDARTLAFSSDNLAVLSASGDTVKVWNRSTLQVIRTMTCEYALCSLFVPGDRQIILGTKVSITSRPQTSTIFTLLRGSIYSFCCVV